MIFLGSLEIYYLPTLNYEHIIRIVSIVKNQDWRIIKRALYANFSLLAEKISDMIILFVIRDLKV